MLYVSYVSIKLEEKQKEKKTEKGKRRNDVSGGVNEYLWLRADQGEVTILAVSQKGLPRGFQMDIFLCLEDPHSVTVFLLTRERIKAVQFHLQTFCLFALGPSSQGEDRFGDGGVLQVVVLLARKREQAEKSMPVPGPRSMALLLCESPGSLSIGSRGQKWPVG